MATVPMPPITYKPNLPASVLEGARLSAVQLEAISIAGQQNEIVLPGGARASALVGDGTGVGKGRIAAGILWDNYRQGRKRLAFVSEKWDLMQDAMDAFDGIGAEELMRGIKREGGKWVTGPNAGILPMKKYNVKADIKHDGVLFTTYALIRSGDKKGNRRVAQLERYLRGDDDGEGAYIIYDESHNLKNAVAALGGEVSQIGTAVKELMERMPKLRTTSLSATAATDVINLGYLDRLGLWGPGTPFPNGFREFGSQVASGGMAAMELIARELKAQGKYVSRTLSFKGVTYSEEEHHLTPEQKELYRTAARAWSSVIQRAEGTIRNTTNGGRAARSNFMSQLGGAQQRFFNVLITTLKIPTAIELANKALADNKAVVITLVNTNEAAQNREKNKAKNLDESEDEELLEYDFGPKEMLVDLVRNHYPVQQYKDDVDSSGNPVKTPVYRPGPDGEEIPVLNPEAVAQRDALIAEINRDLHLPENPLDALINGLGGYKKVAELTGRKEYFDRTQDKFVFRGDPNVSRKDVNIMEMRNFQSGKKKIAVLSSAAGTGISLHASNRAENQRRRYQICLQVGWSADKQMQMFGRTHRTDQASAPEYVMLVSDLGGEKRFVSTIARRLGSLGALTKGQKNATSGSDLMEKVNFETDQGRQATNSFYTSLLQDGPVPGTDLTGMEILTALRILEADGNISRANRANVTRLLNRMLALDPDVQNAAYNYFYDIFQSIVQAAIENNTLDTGVRSLPGDEFTVKPQRVIATDPATGATTHYQPVDAKVRMERVSPTELRRRLRAYSEQKARLITGGDGDKLILAMDASPIVHADGRLEAASYIAYPGNGKWQKVSNSQLRKALPVSEWAEEKLHAAERDLNQTERDLTWRRKDLNEQTAYERERQQRTHGSRITQLESRLSYQDAGEARTRTEQELATARKAYAEAQTFEFEPDHYQRSAVTSLEEKLVKDQAAVEKAKPIAQDPQKWALDRWGEQYEAAPSHAVQEHHFITGAVMRYWNPIKESTAIRNSIFTATDSKTGKRIVGISIPDNRIGNLLSRIEGGGSTVNADQLYSDVLRNNLTYELETGIQVMQGRIGRTPVIQMIPSSRQVGDQLVALGLKYERGITPIYYVPNAAAGTAGVHNILTKVLKEFPVKPEEGTKKDEGGAEPTYVTLGSGLGALQDPLAALYRKDIVPAARKVSTRLRGALDNIRMGLAPQTRGEPARKGYGLLREMGAEIDQRRDRAVSALKAYRAHFYSLPEEHGVHGLDVYDAIETGQTQGLSPVDQAFAGIVRQLFDGRYQELKALGRLNSYIEDYLPHEYKKPDDAARWVQNWLSKRPMAGSEAFRKRRVYPTMREALEDPDFSLEAKFDNPVDFVLSKLGQMDKSITAHLIFEELEDEGRLQYVPAGGKVPAGMAAIDDKIFTVFGPKRGAVKIDPIDPDKQEAKPEAQDFATPAEFKDALRDWKATTIQPEDVRVFGKREMGRYYAAEPLAAVINNHLSPGISFLDAYKIWRDVNNTLNMVSLSSSWYHGLTTTLNSSFSDMALGMKQALAGKPVEGATSVARGFVPFASIVSDFFKGTAIQKVWDGEMAAPDVMTAAIVDALKQGGGKARQDMYYATSYTEGISKAWNQPDNPIGAAWGATWRLPFAAMELTMKPIMEYLVPRAKLGAFAKRAQLEIEQNPTMGLDEAREKFGKIWDAMDDRFGQLSQRNLMMNAIVKDLMNAVVGRPGWNIGSIRALGGGLYDALKMIGEGARGKRPEFSDRTAFLIAMILGGAILNGLVSWFLSGQKPDELMDYVMPRDGGVTEDGRPSRIVLPTYVAKDLYSYLTRPVATLKAKASPALTIASDLLSNRNFYGQKIHGRGGVGVANYLKSAATPYSVQGLQKNLERGESPAKTVLPFVGIMPAGKRVGLSKAEQIITEYRDEQRANTPPAPTAHSRARSQVFQAAKSGDMAKAHRLGNEAIKEGTLTQHDVLHAIQRGKESPLINDVKTLPFNVALEVFDAATPAERKQIEPLVRKKVFAARTKSPSEWDNDTRTLAAKWFRVRMRQPTASGDFATPSAIQ